MRPYGLEDRLIAWPDIADIQGQARKSSVGQPRKKSGHHHSLTRSSAAKRATRVAIKRGARRAGREAIASGLRD